MWNQGNRPQKALKDFIRSNIGCGTAELTPLASDTLDAIHLRESRLPGFNKIASVDVRDRIILSVQCAELDTSHKWDHHSRAQLFAHNRDAWTTPHLVNSAVYQRADGDAVWNSGLGALLWMETLGRSCGASEGQR